jgi:hypothetical protein
MLSLAWLPCQPDPAGACHTPFSLDAKQIEFTVRGEKIRLTTEEVVAKLKDINPEPARALVVDVGGVSYPVKQAFSEVTGMDRADFGSHQARNVFLRLGFTVRRIE